MADFKKIDDDDLVRVLVKHEMKARCDGSVEDAMLLSIAQHEIRLLRAENERLIKRVAALEAIAGASILAFRKVAELETYHGSKSKADRWNALRLRARALLGEKEQDR